MQSAASYFLQPCYFDRGQIGWTMDHGNADFFAIYSGEPWGSYQFISGWETAMTALSEMQKLLATNQDMGVSADLAPPFPANPQLEEIGATTE